MIITQGNNNLDNAKEYQYSIPPITIQKAKQNESEIDKN